MEKNRIKGMIKIVVAASSLTALFYPSIRDGTDKRVLQALAGTIPDCSMGTDGSLTSVPYDMLAITSTDGKSQSLSQAQKWRLETGARWYVEQAQQNRRVKFVVIMDSPNHAPQAAKQEFINQVHTLSRGTITIPNREIIRDTKNLNTSEEINSISKLFNLHRQKNLCLSLEILNRLELRFFLAHEICQQQP